MSGGYNLYIYGGYIVIDAMGDGIDVNGAIEMGDGTVIINGPTNDGNGLLDYLETEAGEDILTFEPTKIYQIENRRAFRRFVICSQEYLLQTSDY